GVKLIGCRAAGTMIHSGDGEQPHELLCSAIVHAIYFRPPVDGVFNRKYWIAHAVHNQQLAATFRKRSQIGRVGHHEIQNRLSKLPGLCGQLRAVAIEVDSEERSEGSGTGARDGCWGCCEQCRYGCGSKTRDDCRICCRIVGAHLPNTPALVERFADLAADTAIPSPIRIEDFAF